jgi:tRNA(His) 5'-end guanylyltransferase
MHTVAGWSVLVGAYSEIIFETACNDLDLLERALKDRKFRELKANLLNYVKNYKTKVLIATGKKDAYTMDVGEDTVKFNQTWDLISDKKAEYGRFTRQEFYPLLEEIGVSVAREWEVLIGDGPSIICEGRATDLNSLIVNLQSKKFQKAKHKLKEYIERYESRILTFHIQKIKGYKSASYEIISS